MFYEITLASECLPWSCICKIYPLCFLLMFSPSLLLLLHGFNPNNIPTWHRNRVESCRWQTHYSSASHTLYSRSALHWLVFYCVMVFCPGSLTRLSNLIPFTTWVNKRKTERGERDRDRERRKDECNRPRNRKQRWSKQENENRSRKDRRGSVWLCWPLLFQL